MKRHIFTVSILLVAAQLFGQESRFWVGGSGKWADANHWAIVSGGEPGATVPESGTSVVFDENSFSGSKNTVTVGENVTVAGLKSSDADFVFSGKKGLTVNGSIDVDSKVDFGKLRGELVLSGSGEVNLPSELVADIVIEGGSWTLTSDLTTEGNVTLKSGSFSTNGYKLECAEFTAAEEAAKLNIEKSTIVCDKWNTSSATKMTVKAESTEMLFRNDYVGNILVAEKQNYNTKSISLRSMKEGKGDPNNIEITYEKASTCPWNSSADDTPASKLRNGEMKVRVKNVPGKFTIKVTNLDVLLSANSEGAIKVQLDAESGIEYPFSNLKSGSYVISYESGNNIIKKDHSLGAETFSVDMDYTPANCYKDPIDVTAAPQGGSGSYDSYVWTSMQVGTPPVDGLTLTNVKYGSYWQVTFKDTEGCYFSERFVYDDPDEDENVIYKDQPKEVKITKIETEPACGTSETGIITVTAEGNETPYKISEITGYTPSDNLIQKNVKEGTYTIKVKDGRGCESEAKKATVGSVPVPSASAGSDVEFCLCNATERTLSGASISIGKLYEWRVVSGSEFAEIKAGTEKNLNPTVVLKAVGTAKLAMWVTNGTCDTIKPQRSVTVVAQPAPTITGGGDKCKEFEITDISNTSGGDLVAVLDDGEDESGVDIVGLKVIAKKQGTYNVKVKETLTVGGEECVGYSNVISLSFYLDPEIEITEPNKGHICGVDAPVTLTAKDKNNPLGGTTWSWSKVGFGTLASDQTSAPSYTPAAGDLGGVVTFTATATNYCKSSPKDYSIEYHVNPNPSIKAVAKHFCGPEGELEATVTDGDTITWEMPDGVQLVSSVPGNGKVVSGTKATAKIKLTGAYTSSYKIVLKEKNAGNCETPTSIIVNFDAEPVLKFMKDGKEITSGEVCAGDKFHVKGVYENCLNLNWNADQDNSLLEIDQNDYDARYYNSVESKSESKETIYIYPVLANTSSCKSDDYEKKLELKIKAQPKLLVSDDTIVCGLEVDFNNIRSIAESSINATPAVNVTRVGQNRFEVVDKNKTGQVTISETYKGCSTEPKTVTVKFVPEPEVTGETSVSVCKGVSTCNVKVDTAYCQVVGWETEGGVSTGFDNNMSCNAVYTFTPADITNKGVKLVFKYKGKGPCDKDEIRKFEVNVNINDLPTYQIEVTNTDVVCAGDERVYKIEPGLKSYKWFIGTTEQSSTSNEFKTTWSDGGSYTVSVAYVDNNNCAPATNPTYPVSVEELPEITVAEDPISFCSGNPADKKIDVTSPTATNVEWTGNGIQFLDDVNILTPKFNSPDDGTYYLTLKVEDANKCKNEADVTVKNIKSPTVKAADTDSIRVCFGTTEVEMDGDIIGDMTLVQSNKWRGGTDDFGGTENMLSGATYFTSPSDWKAGSVWLYLDVVTDCGTITDSVKLVFLPEMVAAVGSESPFYISENTLIEVSVTATHKHFGQVGFYLVSPTGKSVKLYNYLEDGLGCDASDAKKIGNIKDLKFTTAVTTPLNLCELLSSGNMVDGNYTGSFGVTEAGGWSNLYGEDPAKGGWSVLVKDGFAGSTGTLLEASISFTDKNQQGKLKTIEFDSKAISQPIADHASTSYYVPMGLRTSCYGTCDARAIANAVGGSGTYNEFVWANDPAFTDVFNETALVDLCAGTYYVRVVDDNKCQAETSIEVLSPEEIKIYEVGTHKDLTCFGDSTATITVTSENWIGKANYEWSDALTGRVLDTLPTVKDLYAGDFRVVVTDVNECMSDTVFTIKEPTQIEIEKLEITKTCGNDGVAAFTIKENSGTPGAGLGYKLYYKNGESAATFTEVTTGLTATDLPSSDSLIFRIEDGVGCYIDTTINTVPNTLTLKTSADKIQCFGGTTSATVEVTIGTAKSYKWNDEAGQETATAIGLKAGTYIVSVEDEIGCVTKDTITIEEEPQIIAKVEYTEPICYGNEGYAHVKASATGGVPVSDSYTYLWLDERSISVSADSIFNRAELGATYYLSVKDKYCEIIDTIEIANPAQLTITMGTVEAADCGVANGAAEVESVGGGLAPYNYKWNALFDEVVPADNEKKSISGLEVGFYVVEVTDSLGCQITDTVEINGGGNLAFETATAGVSCITLNNGQAQVYNVTSNGAAANDAQIFWNGDNTTPFTQADTIKTLAYGLNKFMVTTANGCRAGYVNIDDSKALQVVVDRTPIVRDGSCEGGFEATITGGSGVYTYTLKDAEGKDVDNDYNADEAIVTANGLCAGTYYLHVDIEGGSDCPVNEPIEIENSTLSYDIDSPSNGITHVMCQGDSTGIIVGNAVGGYYKDEYVYEWRSDVWGEDSVRTTASINGLPAGSYNLTVFQYHKIGTETDTLKYENTFVVNEPTTKFEVLADSIHVAGSHCYDSIGSILIGVNSDAFHGTPASYTFSFDGWSQDSVKTTPTLANLPAGEYGLKVVDNLGCSYKTTIEVEDLSKFTVEYETKEPSCYGYANGYIKVQAYSENGGLKYSWTKDGLAIEDSTALLIGLKSAKYVVTVADEKKCVKEVEIELEQPDTLLANVVFDQPIVCYGDTEATFHSDPLGGNGGFTYLWTDAVTGETLSLDSTIMNAGEGSYAIKVVDKNKCLVNDTIVISYPDSLYVEMAMEKSECAGTTGYAAVKINGGVAPYVVSWTAKYSTDTVIRTDTLLPGVVVDTLKNVGPDMYYVSVIDALGTGCSVVDSVEVLDDGDLRFIPTKTDDIYCISIANGGAVITEVANGKTFDFYTEAKIIWNGGTDTVNIGDTLKTLHYGKNIVQVISMPDGCRKYGSLEFTDDLALRIVNVENIPVRGVETATNGALIAEIAGGYTDYTCIWQNEAGDTLQVDTTDANTSLYGLSVGKYILYVKDQNPETCEIIDTIEIRFEPLRYDTIVLKNVTCNGWNDGKIEVKGKGGLHRPYFYEWSSPMWPDTVVVNTPDIADLKAGQYMLKMWQLYSSDSLECLYDTIVITEPANKLSISKLLIDSIPSHCYDSIGAIVINQPVGYEQKFGGNAPFTYKFSRDDWAVEKNSGNEEKVEVTGLTIGDYNLYVVDSLGCDYSTTVTINDLSEFRIKNVVVEKPICYDEYGKIAITPTSNNGGFKYSWTKDSLAIADTTATLENIKAGTYVVKVTDDSSCVKFETIELEQPNPITFSVSNTIENSCFNVADGEVLFTNITGGRNLFSQFIFVNPENPADVKLSVNANVDTTVFTLSLNDDDHNLISGKYNVRVKDAVGCLSDTVSLVVNSKYPQIDIKSYISTADVTGPDCQAYTADGKISDNGQVKINFKQVSGTVSFKFDNRSVTDEQQPTFKTVTSGKHLLTVGYTDKLVCAVTGEIEVKGIDSFEIEEAGFRQNGKDNPAIFTCPDQELSAYVKASGQFDYSFYAGYIEEPVEEVVVPVDTAKADTSNMMAYVSRYRTMRFYADSPVVEPQPVPVEVKKPAYSRLDTVTINGQKVVYAVFAESKATNNSIGWAEFMPYGGETYYYVSASDGKCMDIDSIKATSMKPVNKLNARLGGDDAFRFTGTKYEVAEGALAQFEANTPEFEFGNSQSIFSESYWKWEQVSGVEGSGFMPEIDNTGNPMVAKVYGEIGVMVTDSVLFTAYDAIYDISDELTCYYHDTLRVNAISGIIPADVFTPNGDNANEVWKINGLSSYANVTIYVFNRWGGRVWQYSGSGLDYDAHRWNGRNAKNKPLPSGTYYYVIQCSDDVLVGKKVTGPVTIIR